MHVVMVVVEHDGLSLVFLPLFCFSNASLAFLECSLCINTPFLGSGIVIKARYGYSNTDNTRSLVFTG